MKNKFFSLFAIAIIGLASLSLIVDNVYAASTFTLNMEVRVDEILTENVQVAAVYFSTSTGQIDENVTQTGYTVSGGTISFTLDNVKNSYFLLVSSHGCFPTIKNQFAGVIEEAFDPVKGDSIGTIERKINLKSGLENVTRVKAKIILPAGSTPTIITGGISHKSMENEIAFGMVYAASTASYIYIDNVPNNLGEVYMIHVFSPKLNLAVDKEFKLTEEPLVDFTGSEAMPPELQWGETTGDLLFKGIVTDIGGAPIVDAGVEVWNNFENNFFTKTDKNGYYGIYVDYFVPPDTYTFLINAQCYEGRKEEYYIASATYTHIYSFSGIMEAYGGISGEIRMSGSLVPNSKINVWGDESFWDVDGDTNTLAVDNPGNSWGDYYSRDGKFEITGLAPGNYILELHSEFYKEGVYTYNTGETGKSEPTLATIGESDHEPQGDDLRVTVFTSSCSVFSSSGTVISSYVVVNIPYEPPTQPAKITGKIKLISGTGIEPEWPITVVAHEYWEDFTHFPCTADFELTVMMDGPDTYVSLNQKQVRTEDIFSVNGSTPGQPGGALETIGMWWTDWDNGELWWQAGAIHRPLPGSTVTVVYCYKDDPYTDFKSISGSQTVFPFELNVENNKKYRVEINGSKYGVIWEKGLKDIRADLTIPATYYVLPEILVTSAGAIKGIVKKPNGEIFKPIYEKDKHLGIDIEAQGKSVVSLGRSKIYIDGTFSIEGLFPGTYRLITKSTSTNISIEWTDGILDNVVVNASTKPTNVVIYLREGLNVLPQVDMQNVLTSGATTYFVDADENSYISIMGVKTGEKLNPDNLKKVIMDEPEIGLGWHPVDGWLPSKIPTGKYDFYTGAIREYSPEAGIGDPMGIFFSCKKGVTIDESLITGTTQFISLPEAVIGSSDTVLTGTISGSKIFTQENMFVIKNNFDEFFNLIPYIMLHNNDTGELAAISILMPPATINAEKAYMEAAQKGDLAALKNALINYPPSYKFKFLRPGNYTATAYSPNYPRYIKQITIIKGENDPFNINLDESAGEGATITGSVSSGGNPVVGASIIIKKKGIEKKITSNFSGNYQVKGLEKGYYQIEVSKAGYALKVVTVNMTQYKTYTKDISLTEGKETISGLVYSQYFPSPKVYEGARIVAYDIDSTDEVLGLYQAISDSNGYYEINGLISGHKYKVWIIAPGKRVYAVEHTACEEISGYNLVLSDILPDFNVNYKVSGSSVTFNIESVKPLDYLPPDVKYSEGVPFDASSAIDVSISTITAENIWRCSIPVSQLSEDKVFTFLVRASDIDVGVGNLSDYKPTEINFSLKKKIKVEVKLDEFFAKGGDIELDDTGEDSSYITIPVGAIREISVQGSAGIVSAFDAAGKKAADVEICAIGGFASLIFSKESIVGEIQDIISEIYEIKLENTDINENKNITLNLSYDRAKIGEVYSKVNIRRFNESLEKWEPVEGVTTIDPINGTVSIEVSNLNSADAGGSFSAQSITQSGKFAVFYGIPYEQTGPDSYSGDKFRIYNFPNPFNSSEKTVTLKNHGSLSAFQTIEGTVLKYYLPAKYGSNTDIEFYIYNIAGELVRTINEETRDGGYIYFAGWDGRNDGGEKCASGVYLLIPKVNGDTVMDEALKMAIIK